MAKKSSKKSNPIMKLVLAFLLVVIAAFGFLSLLFNLTDINVDLLVTKVDGQVNGYSIMDNPGAIKDCGEWLSTYSIIYMVCAGLGALFAFGLALLDKLTKSKFDLIVIGLSIVTAIVYAINGFVAKGEVSEVLGSAATVNTFAYIPVIIVAVLSLTYVVLKGTVKK